VNLNRRHGFAGLWTGAHGGGIGRALCAAAVTLLSGRLLLAQASAPHSTLIDSLAQHSVSSAQLDEMLRRRRMPLVEPAGDSNHKLVTFVWHGDSATRNVVVVTPLTLIDFSGGIMTRVTGTDLWYRSYVLPDDTRFVYRYAPNDNLVPFERDTNLFARMGEMHPDPLNPRVFDYGQFGTMSILELAKAPTDTLIHRRSGVRAGVVSRAAITSRVLREDRTVWIYTPSDSGRARTTAYPLLVLFDGQSYQSLIPTPDILDNLIADGTIPPVIAVFIDNPAGTRERDLNCNGEWSTFITTELIPWVEGRYRIDAARARRVVGGYSLGGLAAACAAVQHPEAFGSVIAQSGSFYRAPHGQEPEWVARELARRPRLPIRFALSIGRLETAVIPSRDPSMLTASRHLRDVLLAKGYAVSYRELSSGHEHVAWRAVFGDMLVAAFAPAAR
jgi:enterochelin esterase-like enzyme